MWDAGILSLHAGIQKACRNEAGCTDIQFISKNLAMFQFSSALPQNFITHTLEKAFSLKRLNCAEIPSRAKQAYRTVGMSEADWFDPAPCILLWDPPLLVVGQTYWGLEC